MKRERPTKEIKCNNCHNVFSKELHEYKRQIKRGRSNFYCSQECLRVGRDYPKKYKEITKQCAYCEKLFATTTNPKAKKCCSKKCSAKYSSSFQTEKSQIKKSIKMRENWKSGVYGNISKLSKYYEVNHENIVKKCIVCDCEFSQKFSYRPKKCCSKLCVSKRLSEVRKEENSSPKSLSTYRRKCAFNFALNKYPNEFDFSLIVEHGWYKPKNRGDNLGGVSRDHKISVKWGWDNNIDSRILSHPANCQLMIHSDNFAKREKCDITIDQLKEDIKTWDKKYGKFYPELIL